MHPVPQRQTRHGTTADLRGIEQQHGSLVRVRVNVGNDDHSASGGVAAGDVDRLIRKVASRLGLKQIFHSALAPGTMRQLIEKFSPRPPTR